MNQEVMGKKLKAVFIIPTLDKGGAERVLVHLVNHFEKNTLEPVIFCLQKKGDLLALISKEIKVIDLGTPRLYFSLFKIRKQLKIHRPDIVIGWMGHVNAYLAFCRPFINRRIGLMCRESSIPSRFISYYKFPFLFRLMYRCYNRFAGIISQSEEMRNDLVKSFRVRPDKIRIIPNPVVASESNYEIPENVQHFIKLSGKILLFVGRFSTEKRIEICVQVMQFLPASYKLILVGYGDLETQIKQEIDKIGFSDRIMIQTSVADPTLYYRMADCLLLTSEFEGFPNVLLEAGQEGCPAVVFKTVGGAQEIIDDENGIYLEPSSPAGIESFAEAIKSVCENSGKFNRGNIKAKTQKKYNIRNVVEQYTNYIQEKVSDLHTNSKK